MGDGYKVIIERHGLMGGRFLLHHNIYKHIIIWDH